MHLPQYNSQTMKIDLRNKDWYAYSAILLIMLVSIMVLKPHIAGDSYDYLRSIDFLTGHEAGQDFTPNRLLTTFGGLQSVIILTSIFRSMLFSWFFMNAVFYFFFCLIFYKMIMMIHDDEEVALISMLFVAGNYALIVFGLNFLMDMGGWFSYMLSLYLSLLYLRTSKRKFILFSAFSAGVGMLFKEYAVLGIIPIACVLIYENLSVREIGKSIIKIFKSSFFPALLAMSPVLILYSFIYLKFDYTYADWLATNHERYDSFNKLAEYVKSFGSLLTVLGAIFLLGLHSLYKNWHSVSEREKVFIISLVLSVTPLFIWPGITQRVLFVSVPAIATISSFFFREYKKYSFWFALLFIAYFLLNIFMDSFVLKFVNLPF